MAMMNKTKSMAQLASLLSAGEGLIDCDDLEYFMEKVRKDLMRGRVPLRAT